MFLKNSCLKIDFYSYMSYKQKNIFILHSLKAYFITGCIVKKSVFPFSKIINNWDLYFNDTSLESFVLLLYLVVFITIYVSTCFSSHWIKGFWSNFFHPPLFCGIDETFGLCEKLCNLKRLGGGGRKIFYRVEIMLLL